MNMRTTILRCCIAVVTVVGISPWAMGVQGPLSRQFQVTKSTDSIEIIAGSSQRLKFDYDIPELMVENSEVISVTAVSANEILITGEKPGMSTVTVSDSEKNLQSLTVTVNVDVRPLERAYTTHFPDSQIRVAALKTGVILSGNVARADQIQNIMAVAQDYFPTKVINELQINGSQNIAIQIKVYEVSRSKLRQLGVDWSFLGEDVSIVSSISGLIQQVSSGGVQGSGETLSFGVLNDSNSFNAFIQALEKHNLAKLLDQPVLVAQNGRPAEFLSGGEVPIQVASGLGSNSIEFRAFGTKLDMVPIVHGAGLLTLEVRAEVSEIANDLSGATDVPGFRVRRVNTGVKMKAGHTLALAGDYREDTQIEKVGIPKIMDNPLFGPLFRRIEEEKNETELVFLITPRFISEVEPDRVPRLGPGQLTSSPSDKELYIDGYMEVPRCTDDCPTNNRFDDPAFQRNPNLLPAYGRNGAPADGAQPANPQPYTNSYYNEPSVNSNFGSSQQFQGNVPQSNPVKQAKNGFLWPSKSKNR